MLATDAASHGRAHTRTDRPRSGAPSRASRTPRSPASGPGRALSPRRGPQVVYDRRGYERAPRPSGWAVRVPAPRAIATRRPPPPDRTRSRRSAAPRSAPRRSPAATASRSHGSRSRRRGHRRHPALPPARSRPCIRFGRRHRSSVRLKSVGEWQRVAQHRSFLTDANRLSRSSRRSTLGSRVEERRSWKR